MEFGMYEKYLNRIKEEHYREPHGIHGISHVKRVLRLAEKISSHYDLTEREERVLALAACYHDIGRVHNEWDVTHGLLSSRKTRDLGLLNSEGLTPKEEALVLKLITTHSLDDTAFEGMEQEVLLHDILKDADGLDRVRIFDLDPRYLRLPESRDLVDLAWGMFLGEICVDEV